jgi:hypothetical protein
VLFGAVNYDSPSVMHQTGGCGVASAPRVLTFHPYSPGFMQVQPAEEITSLRVAKLASLRSISPGRGGTVVLTPSTAGVSLDVLVTVLSHLRAGSQGVAVRVRQHGPSDEHAEVAIGWLDSASRQDVEFIGEDLGYWDLPADTEPASIPRLCDRACVDSADCVGWTAEPVRSNQLIVSGRRCNLKHTIPPSTKHPSGSGFISGNIATHYLALRRTTLGLPTSTPDRIARLDGLANVTSYTLRILVDHSLIECFALGRAITARFYPAARSMASGVSLIGADMTVDVDIWSMPLNNFDGVGQAMTSLS